MKYPQLNNYIDGTSVAADGELLDVISPLDGSLLSRVPLSTRTELDRAVESAQRAFPAWSTKTMRERAQVFYRYRELLQQNIDELTTLVHEENGKTPDEARAETLKAIEVTEFACSLPQWTTGEVLEVSPGVECRVERKPLGVVASIVPFNFPVMVPHWTIPIALALVFMRIYARLV